MTDISIEHLGRDRLSEARKLVWRCFPHQTPPERFSFWAIAHRDSPSMRWLMARFGVADFLNFWGAIDSETGQLLGTTGLYACTYDVAEAVWLAWFCVAPEARRQGTGSRLLDFSIEQAKRAGRSYLRLYTWDRSDAAAAQILYESRGLKIVCKKWRLFYTTLYRELLLDPSGAGGNEEETLVQSEIHEGDLDALRAVVSASVSGSVTDSEEDATALIEEIIRSLNDWMESGSSGFHRKYSVKGRAVGFIIVQDYERISHLFVLPESQRRGIGRSLVEAAVQACRAKSPGRTIQLNSSSNAAGFYEAMGFRRTGPGLDRPGGCIPYEYRL